ncbi:MAG: glutamine-hydrolyzing carbamoyl-phosphate synthase small subunit [Candidatus Xenobia bacterium]
MAGNTARTKTAAKVRTRMRTARLALADGSIWRGTAFGAVLERVGEVVFNTSLTGYQEILTDPSYEGQMVVMTAPHIGNTGINLEDDESRRVFLSGFLVRALSPCVSNWRATGDLSSWLAEQKVPGISGIDTRALTRRLRDQGSMKGCLSTDEQASDETLVARAQAWPGLDGVDLAKQVTCSQSYSFTQGNAAPWRLPASEGEGHVVVYDFGVKRNILRRLVDHGLQVTVVPAGTGASDVLGLQPDGVLLSNGPGDPAAVPYAVEAARQLIGKLPILGICLGHQILGQALGGRTYRLKFGHHGGNQPVKHLPTGRTEISAHNHNFAVDAKSLPEDVEVTHVNLNDNCCEGMRHRRHAVLSVQYHPEAAPGPPPADPVFDEFVEMVTSRRRVVYQVGV